MPLYVCEKVENKITASIQIIYKTAHLKLIYLRKNPKWLVVFLGINYRVVLLVFCPHHVKRELAYSILVTIIYLIMFWYPNSEGYMQCSDTHCKDCQIKSHLKDVKGSEITFLTLYQTVSGPNYNIWNLLNQMNLIHLCLSLLDTTVNIYIKKRKLLLIKKKKFLRILSKKSS